jgi:hypothetical protein
LLVAIEEGTLNTFLRAAPEDRSALFSSKSTELKSSTKPSHTPTTTNWKLGMDEDEALLEELEQELRDGKVHGNDLAQL